METSTKKTKSKLERSHKGNGKSDTKDKYTTKFGYKNCKSILTPPKKKYKTSSNNGLHTQSI